MRELSTAQRWGAIGIFAVVATTFTFTLMAGPFGYASVCDKCGARRNTHEWKLPSTEILIFKRSEECDTPLSRTLLTNQIVQAHPHHWLFAQGGGNGVKCALGPGRYILFAVESKELAQLVLTLHQRGQIAFRDRIIRTGLNPRTSLKARELSSFDAPTADTSDAEMRRWVAEQSEYLDMFDDIVNAQAY